MPKIEIVNAGSWMDFPFEVVEGGRIVDAFSTYAEAAGYRAQLVKWWKAKKAA